MNRIEDIIGERDKVKETILFLLNQYGITVHEIVIAPPTDIHTYIERGLEVKIISPDFAKMELLTKTGLLAKLSLEINPRLRAKGFTPEEYQAIDASIDTLKELSESKNIIGPHRP